MTYGEPLVDIARDECLTKKVTCDTEPFKGKDVWELVCLYQDAELQNKFHASYEWVKESSEIVIHPPGITPFGSVYTNGVDEDVVDMYEHGKYRFFEKGVNEDWGNPGKIYMATFYDLTTGEKLDKPLVQVVTIKGEIPEAPKVRFQVTEKGLAEFSWEAVEGAEAYMVVYLEADENGVLNVGGNAAGAYVLGITEDTTWTGETADYGLLSGAINKKFRTSRVSEDDWLSGQDMSGWLSKGAEEGKVFRDDTHNRYFGVIAVNKEGTSMLK